MPRPGKRPEHAAALRRTAEARAQELGKADPTARDLAAMSPAETLALIHELQVHQIELELQNEELRRTQEELQTARARYFELYDLAPAAYCTINEKGLILECNLAAAARLGVVRSRLLQKPLSRFMAPEARPEYHRRHFELLRTGQPQSWELRMAQSDGTSFWALLQISAAVQEDGAAQCKVVFSDLTEVKRAEAALREITAAVEQSPSSIMMASTTGDITYVNPAFTRATGYAFAEVLGQNPRILKSGLVPNEVYRDLWDTLLKGGVWRGEFLNQKKNGHLFWEQAQISPVRDDHGVVTSYVAIKDDITERKRIAAMLQETGRGLREAEGRWAFALDGAGDGVWDWNAQTNQVFFSKGWKAMLGYEEQEIGSGLDEWERRVHPEDLAACQAELERHLSGETPTYVSEHRLRHKDGTYRWILDRGKVVERSPDGGALRVIGTHTDITSRKLAEELLRQSEEAFRTLAESLPQIVWATRADGWNIYFNQRWVDYTGMTMEESHGHGWNTPFHPDDRLRAWDAWQEATRTGGTYALECRLRRADGAYRWMLIRGLPQRGPGGEILKWYGTCTDIDDLRQAEAELLRSEELYRSLFSNMLNGLAYCRMLFEDGRPVDFIYLAVNEAFRKQTGLENVVGRRVSEVIPGIRESDPGLFELYGRVARSGQAESTEVFLAALGMWLSLSVYSPAVEHFVAVFDVITERKQMEEGLRRSEAGLARAQRYARIGSWTWYIQTNRLEWSDEMYRLFGIARESFTGVLADVVAAAIHPEDRAAVEAANRSVAEHGRALPLEYRVIQPDGSVRTLWGEAGELVLDADGRPELLSGTVQDITERKEAERALRESEARFASMAEHSPVALYRYSNLKGGTYYSPPVLHLLGYTPDELLAQPMRWHDAIHPDDVRLVDATIGAALASSGKLDLTYRIRHRDGRLRWFRDSAHCRQEASGERIIDGVAADITEQKQAELALLEANELLSQFIARSPVYAYIMEVTPGASRVLQASDNFSQLTGISGSEMIGRTMGELFPAEMADKFTMDDWTVVSSGQGVELEEVLGDRSYYTMKFPILLHGRTLLAGFSIDITEREQARRDLAASQQQLRLLLVRLQRVQEEERLRVSRIVHDELGQLLTELKLDLGWLERRLSDPVQPLAALPLLDKVMGTSELVDTTIQTVQRIAAELRPNTLDSLGLFAALRQEARRFEAHSGLPCTLTLEGAWPALDTAVSTELFYICREALTNAARHARARQVQIRLREEPETLALEVVDDGVGMDPSQPELASSLGLLGMRERARIFGGEIAFEPNVPSGTRVVVTVPAPRTPASGGAQP